MNAWLILILVLSSTVALAQPASTVQLEVSGRLVEPACRLQFATSMEVDLGNATINQLKDDTVPVTEIPLSFDCRAGSGVSLVLTAAAGRFDEVTLLTNRPGLGLRLIGEGSQPGLTLGQPHLWTAGETPLVVSLRVKPVALETLPEAGTFTATLLMQLVYP